MRARSSTGPHILSLAGEASWEAKTVRGFHGDEGGGLSKGNLTILGVESPNNSP